MILSDGRMNGAKDIDMIFIIGGLAACSTNREKEHKAFHYMHDGGTMS